MKISIYGQDVNAVVAATCLAEAGHEVYLSRIGDASKQLSWDESYIEREPGLLTRYRRMLGRNLRVRAFKDARSFGTVQWVFGRGQSDAALQQVFTSLAKAWREGVLYLLTSHHSVGTYQRMGEVLKEGGVPMSDQHCPLVSMPTMIREGVALADFESPALLVVGTNDEFAIATVTQMLRPYINRADKTLFVDGLTAEITRNAISTMLATRLSFMNKLAQLCENLGVDVEVVREAMAGDPRVGSEYLNPGCGFGGDNLADELANVQELLPKGSAARQLVDAVAQTNEEQKEILFRKVWRYYQANIQGRTIAIWGAAFKPGTDSLVNSPILTLLEAFWAQGVITRVYDPQALDALRLRFQGQELLECVDSPYEAAENADALLIVTAWKEFYNPDFEQLKALLAVPAIFDGRNIYEPEVMQELGFEYFGLGRGLRI
ncbi:MAG: UDP-glucose/GDP-mannose dehydrogenase family protein [Hahellaceae bacterium]|nr:UDP-glucose/GDP-mannose dehydrogenase family protein [Hahellaceae bacterium]